jgi:predicted PurR-regulated permease PerM
MTDLLTFLFNSKSGSILVTLCVFGGVLAGLFYKYKAFVSKEYLNLYSYSKEEIDDELEKLKNDLVSERIFDIKLDSIHSKLKSMDEKQEERHERLSQSINKLEGYIQTITKNI